ncbi:MAG: hypothetical protein KIT83_12600 [Bryobacterales bacterium]|nr:hypothetical protein [Bryobacterales bacterium]
MLASTGHEGATGGPGERFADCYMLYLMNQVAGHRTGHPVDRAAYQGEQATRVAKCKQRGEGLKVLKKGSMLDFGASDFAGVP